MAEPADRNLLVGILAVQMDFVTRDQLITGMHDWLLDKSHPLEELLAARGALKPDARQLLASLVDMHLKLHGGDTEASLAALSSVEQVRAELSELPDVELQASLGHIPVARSNGEPEKADPFATIAAGQATSQGMRFRILRPYARGGLGEVSIAHDTELNREVALKQIQSRYADNSESRARFIQEAQITGGLEHPGVVPVYGLGTYGDGRPFYAMRFIRGDSLKDGIEKFFQRFEGSNQPEGPWVRDEEENKGHKNVKLPAAAYTSFEFRHLLGQFLAVCNAVAYAHVHGVLHRDLKPANIMLGKYGETLVVDWGLAKLTGNKDGRRNEADDLGPAPSHPSAESTATMMGSVLGTLGYMSPEQASGRLDLIGPAADIYSLGATLYHILTGRPPHIGNNQGQVLKQIEAGDFAPPRSVNAHIPPALNAICLKAMALAPQARYPTALALAADIEHYLADEPITAGQDPLLLRARRWMRKRPGLTGALVAAVAVGLIGLSIGLGIMSAKNQELEIANGKEREARSAETAAKLVAQDQKKEADKQRASAEKRLAQVEKGVNILASIFADLNPLAEQSEGRPLGAILAERLDHAAAQLDGESVGDPVAVAKLQSDLGRALLNLGYPEKAIEIFARSRDALSANLGAEHPDTLRSISNLALAYQHAGKLDLALPLYERTLALHKARLGPEHPDTLISMNNLASGYRASGKPDLALPLLEQALKLRKAKLGPEHADTLMSMNNLASVHLDANQLDLALPLLEQTLIIQKKTLGPEHPYTLTSMNNLACGYQAAGKLDLALPLFEETLELRKAKLGAAHPDTLMSMNNLASLHQAAGKLDLALPLFEQALGLRKAKLGPEHPDTLMSMNNLATAYQEAGKLDWAIALSEQTLALQKAKLGPNHSETLASMRNLASKYIDARRLDLALPLFEQTLAIVKAKVGQDHPDTLQSMDHLAMALVLQKKFADAETLLISSYEAKKNRAGQNYPAAESELTAALERLIELYTAWERPKELARWKQELDTWKKTLETAKN